jgi:hypothetical protein
LLKQGIILTNIVKKKRIEHSSLTYRTGCHRKVQKIRDSGHEQLRTNGSKLLGLLGFWTSGIIRYSKEHVSEAGSVSVLR